MDENKNNNFEDIEMGSSFETTKDQAPTDQPTSNSQENPAQEPREENKKTEEDLKKKKEKKKINKKKVAFGCLGIFGFFALVFLVMSFIFIAQGPETENPIAKILGVSQAGLINFLVGFVNVILILIALGIFVFMMAGLFRASMARKDDKEAKKKGLKLFTVSAVIFFIFLIIWVLLYIYLDGKRIYDGQNLEAIITDPEETLDLSAPIEIKFQAGNIGIDTEKYEIIAYEWDFGDGETGTGKLTSHNYEEKGVYNVKLTVQVRDRSSGDLLTGGEYEEIISISNQELAAIFEVDQDSGEAPLTVEFDASKSIDPDGTIDRYEWDLDEDGNFDDAEGVAITHTFEKIGEYQVALRVTNTIGEYEISEKTITVEEKSELSPMITVSGDPDEFLVGESYIFRGDDSTSPNGNITKYEWTFSDEGGTKNSRSLTHRFTEEGNFEVTLKITDEEGESAEETKIIQVGTLAGAPKAVISTSPDSSDGVIQGRAPLTIAFDARQSTDSNGDIVDYQWDFDDDGETDAFGATTSHTFSEEGEYRVVLSLVDSEANVGMANVLVKIDSQGLIADLTANKLEGITPLTVDFDASGSSYRNGQISSYQWDFGDGTSPKIGSSQISHRYNGIGSYNAQVTVIGTDGSKATKSITITVREVQLQACFSSVFNEGEAPLQTSFDPSCSSGTISSYLWDFDDGSTSTQVKPIHTFQNAGNYNVRLEILDSDNTVSSTTKLIKVN